MLQLERVNQTLKAEIEERERVEAALQRSQRLEVAGRLTGGLAHDFNNFLHVILMNADLIGAAEGLPPELAGALDSIVQVGTVPANSCASRSHSPVASRSSRW